MRTRLAPGFESLRLHENRCRTTAFASITRKTLWHNNFQAPGHSIEGTWRFGRTIGGERSQSPGLKESPKVLGKTFRNV